MELELELDKIAIGNRIKFERKNINLTQEELATKLGLNNKSSVSQYEKGDALPSDDIKLKMCKIFNCTIDYLMCLTNIREPIDGLKMSHLNNRTKKNIYNLYEYIEQQKNSNLYKQLFPCPVYGKISAGQPNWAEECLDGYLPIDPNLMNILNPEECYFLRVNGESMNKIIKNGAFALIRKTDFVENGEISVVLVNGNDATLKRFSKEGDIIVLTPESTDSSFKQQIYTKDTPIKVIGKYIGKMEMN